MAEDSPERLASVNAKINALGPGPELDARAAQLIGWRVLGVASRFSRGVEPDGEKNGLIPRYSSDPGAAFEFETRFLATEHASLYIAHLAAAVAPEDAAVYSESHLIAIAHAEPDVRCRAALKASMKIPAALAAPPVGKPKPVSRPAAAADSEVELL